MLMPALPEYPVMGIFSKRRNQEEECVSDNYARYLVNCQKTRDRAFCLFRSHGSFTNIRIITCLQSEII